MSMKKLSVLALAGCVALGITANQVFAAGNVQQGKGCNITGAAADNKNVQQKPKMENGRPQLDKELNLTPEQKKQEKALREKYRAKLQPVMEEMKASHEKARAIQKEHMTEFEKILTPEQKAKFEKMQTERQQKMQQGMPQRQMHQGFKKEQK